MPGNGGADPQVRGRRPRRPARTLQDADRIVPAAGRGRDPRGARVRLQIPLDADYKNSV